MTPNWDDFAKAVADDSIPRRETLRRLGLAITATVLGPLGCEYARAGKHSQSPKPPKPPQDPCKTFCRCRNKKQLDQCLKACNACGKVTSRLGGSCGNYFCCGTGQSSCGSYCADLAFDPANCGACGYMCDAPGPYEDGVCLDGRCEYACVDGAVSCDETCTYLEWDPNNCGACGTVCGEPGPHEYAACVDGRCEFGCYEGAVYCDDTCRYLEWDPSHCGACGNVCDESTPICSGGLCIRGDDPCPAGLTRCSGHCTLVSWDSLNCGGCGIVCADGQSCISGICQYGW
jgi:hypothetical protein